MTRLSLSAHRAVVVDDDAIFADAFAALIRLHGHSADVVPVTDADALAARIVECAPDAAFIDIDLGGVDGSDVARALRERGCQAHLVAITGHVGTEFAARSRDAGFDEHWLKPVEPERIERFLDEVAPRCS